MMPNNTKKNELKELDSTSVPVCARSAVQSRVKVVYSAWYHTAVTCQSRHALLVIKVQRRKEIKVNQGQ